MNRFASCIRNRPGFTLIELVCALAISSMLVVVLSAMFQQSLLFCESMEAKDQLYFDGEFTMDYLEREVRSAVAVYGPEDIPLHIGPPGIPLGFILELGPNKFVQYKTYGTVLYRYTSGKRNGFTSINFVKGKNAVSKKMERAVSTIDRKYNTLTVHFLLKEGKEKLELKRVIPIPAREELP